MEKVFQYIDQNQERFINELIEFVKFPSVSKHTQRKQDTYACAEWLKNHLQSLGLEAVLIEGSGHPIVRADKKGKSDKRMILYGHYDVQPEDPLNLWKTPPFEPTIRDGKLYARGASDDKGQLFAHVKAVESLLKTNGELPCSIMFLVEGEEECGGSMLKDYVRSQKAQLDAEAVVVSDGSLYGSSTPAICYGLRGIVAFELIIKGPASDLHSGSFGGAVANPVMILSQILAQCVGTDGQIKIPGIYNRVRPVENWEKENFKALEFDDARFKTQTGIKETFGEPGYETLERIWCRPTFEINGIYGGYMGEGGKTIIPSYAGAKVTLRLVPDMEAKEVCQLITAHLQKIIPSCVNYELRGPSGSNAVIFDVHHPAIQAAKAALQEGFGQAAVYIREGGSIPVVKTIYEELQKPILLMGYGTDADGTHAPNENFSLDNFIKGIKTSTALLGKI